MWCHSTGCPWLLMAGSSESSVLCLSSSQTLVSGQGVLSLCYALTWVWPPLDYNVKPKKEDPHLSCRPGAALVTDKGRLPSPREQRHGVFRDHSARCEELWQPQLSWDRGEVASPRLLLGSAARRKTFKTGRGTLSWLSQDLCRPFLFSAV